MSEMISLAKGIFESIPKLTPVFIIKEKLKKLKTSTLLYGFEIKILSAICFVIWSASSKMMEIKMNNSKLFLLEEKFSFISV